ncbi:MAG: 23S rRNA (adenine(2503)-C(2))-methyltransferase RlmN [Rikenellaceae bacterium]
MINKEWLYGKTLSELEDIVVNIGFNKFVAKQICDWLYKKGVNSFEEMKNLGKAKIAILNEKYEVGHFDYSYVYVSKDGTKKYLFPTLTNTKIESAYIPDKERATLCVSSQKGCRMGCKFCMTARGGYKGNLTSGEILNQVKMIDESDKLTNIVFMGMGEPLDNSKEVFSALEILTSDWGYGWSPTRITLSSIGVMDNLEKFLDNSKVHLAISLHSPFSAERKSIMPVENKFPIAQVLELIKRYDFTHQRRVSFEYIMFDGMNDTQKHIDELVDSLRGIHCRINLIRFHKIPDFELLPSPQKRIEQFRDALTRSGIITTIRASRGEDIYAACGMLSDKKS